MQMSEKEIYKRYQNAKDKEEYPLICSQLNDCKLKTIYEIINKFLEIDGLSKIVDIPVLHKILMDWDEGYSDNEIASRNKTSISNVTRVRFEYDLEKNPERNIFEENLKEILVMYYQGKTDADIASMLRKTTRAVSRWRAENKIPNSAYFAYQRRRHYIEKGMTVEDISEKEKMTYRGLERWMKEKGLWELYERKQSEIKKNDENRTSLHTKQDRRCNSKYVRKRDYRRR